MKTVGIVQARMGSRRLPGKVLKEVLGTPLLGHLLGRVAKAETLDQLVVATSDKLTDDPIAEYCEEANVACFRGSEHDVLHRYAQAATAFQADTIVRLTADCPLLDPKVVDLVVGYFKTHSPHFDYVSNTQDRSFPRGMDVEVFSREALLRAESEAQEPYLREHVTPYFYSHPDRFKLGRIELRLTVDTEDDLELIGRLLEAAKGRDLPLADIVSLLQAHPEWVSINGHLIQEAL